MLHYVEWTAFLVGEVDPSVRECFPISLAGGSEGGTAPQNLLLHLIGYRHSIPPPAMTSSHSRLTYSEASI